MPVKVICTNSACGAVLKVPESLGNRTARCPKCGQRISQRPIATLDLPKPSDARLAEQTLDLPSAPAETLTLSPQTPPENAKPIIGTKIDDRPLTGKGAPAIERIGRFEIRSRLGEGAFGEVFRAYDPQLDREVALKVAKPGTLTTPDRVERFLREAKSAANLRHPNIVPLFETGRDGDRYFIASAFIKGQTLEALLENGRLSQREVATIIRKLAEALAYAHSQGIVHRDVKPANVLIDEHGNPMLTDFGLAARRTGEERMTQDNAVMGTPAYMSPEQAAGKSNEAGPASDQYSLGIMLYEMLTGSRPFEGSMEIVIFNHLQVEPKRLRSVERAVPKDLETICLKCLEKAPGQRYAACVDLAEDLRRWLAGEPVTARRLTWAERGVKWVRRNRAVAAALCLFMLTLVAGTIVAVFLAIQSDNNAAIAKRNENAEKTRSGELAIALKTAEEAEVKAEQRAADFRKERDDKNDALKAKESALLDAEHNLSNGNILLADAAWNGPSDADVARTYLDRVPEKLRNWEWNYLKQKFQGGSFACYGHTDTVHAVAVSKDGSRFVSGAQDSTLRIWDARTGQVQSVLKGHMGTVFCASFNQTATQIASGSNDKTVHVWDAKTGRVLLVLKGHLQPVTRVAFNGDGTQIMSAAGDSTVRIWDAKTGEMLREFKGAQGATHAAYSNDGRLFIGPSSEGAFRFWDAYTGRMLREIKAGRFKSRPSLSPDGERIACADGRDVQVLDAHTGQVLCEMKGHGNTVNCVAFSHDGAKIVSGSFDKTVRIWDSRTGAVLNELKGHTEGVASVAFSCDDAFVLSGSMDNTVRLWNVRGDNLSFKIERLSYEVAVNSDGSVIAHTGSTMGLNILDTLSGMTRRLKTPPGFRGESSVSFSSDGSQIATGFRNGMVRLCDTRSGRTMIEFRAHDKSVQTVVFSRDSLRIATAADNVIRVWSAHSGERLLELSGHIGTVIRVAFSGDGARIVSGAADNALRLWNARTSQCIREMKGHAHIVTCVAFSDDGRTIASGANDKSVRLWDGESGEPLAELLGHTNVITGVALTPDGSRIITGSEDGTVRIWDAKTRQALLELKALTSSLRTMALSGDGGRIVAVGLDGIVQIWDGKPKQAPVELKGDKQVGGAAFTADGTRVVAYCFDGQRTISDAKTGARLPDEPNPKLSPTNPFSPDGQLYVTYSGNSAFVVPAAYVNIPSDEKMRRKCMTRPDPDWHAEHRKRFEKENNRYAAELHRSFEQRAYGVLAMENYQFQKAFGYFLAAALLQPQIPINPKE